MLESSQSEACIITAVAADHTEQLLCTRLENICEVATITNYTSIIQIIEVKREILRHKIYVKLWHNTNDRAINSGTKFFFATGEDLFC